MKRFKHQRTKRKNYFLTFLLTIFFWLLLAVYVYFVDPQSPFAVPGFMTIFFLAFLFLSSIIFTGLTHGLIATIALEVFLLLRLFGVGNILNFLLLLGVAIALDIYFWRK